MRLRERSRRLRKEIERQTIYIHYIEAQQHRNLIRPLFYIEFQDADKQAHQRGGKANQNWPNHYQV
jgi:hypothetical protein